MSVSTKDASPQYVAQPPSRTHQPSPVILTSSLPASLLPSRVARPSRLLRAVSRQQPGVASRRVAAASLLQRLSRVEHARDAVSLPVTMSAVTMTRRTSSFRDRMTPPPLVIAIATVIFATGHALKLGEQISSFPHFFTRGALMPFVAFHFAVNV